MGRAVRATSLRPDSRAERKKLICNPVFRENGATVDMGDGGSPVEPRKNDLCASEDGSRQSLRKAKTVCGRCTEDSKTHFESIDAE